MNIIDYFKTKKKEKEKINKIFLENKEDLKKEIEKEENPEENIGENVDKL